MSKRPVHLKRQSGQSVIIAIAVLFILAFLAALFVILIARNLQRTTRSGQVLTADFYAQAGIRYADQMLTTSPQGADWRPALTDQLNANAFGALTLDEQNSYNLIVGSLRVTPTVDPDYFWLTQGFTRYDTNGGRFLIRLSYGSASTTSPFDNSSTQTGKYIKIESIGRTGTVDPADPTTFAPQPIRLHAELVAYKPIGIVDYARFITNKDQRSDTATLGVPTQFGDALVPNPLSSAPCPSGGCTPSGTVGVYSPGVLDFSTATGSGIVAGTPYLQRFPIVTTYGTATGSGQGGSLRCNTNLELYGYHTAYLNSSFGDDWEIAGNLNFDGYTATPTGGTLPITALNIIGTSGTNSYTAATPGVATPTNAPSFDSVAGLIRDSSPSNDANGYARSIKRLNPPSIDILDPTTRLSRYQTATQTGTVALTTPVNVPAGPYKQQTLTSPATVFIDNSTDIQQESANVVNGAYTLRDDWVNRTSSYWEGGIYTPPGAQIVFGPVFYQTSAAGAQTRAWGFTVSRSDAPVGGTPSWHWTDPVTGKQDTLDFPKVTYVYGQVDPNYVADPNAPVYFLGANFKPSYPSGNTIGGDTVPSTGANTNNDIQIYAEGNVRVRGVISDPSQETTTGTAASQPEHHVTVISNGIAYIDGSILKGGNLYDTAYNSRSTIAILAESYVCVNTTQFLAGAPDFTTNAAEAPERSADPPTLSFSQGQQLTEYFDFPPVIYTGSVTYPIVERLFMSQYAGSAATQSVGDLQFDQGYYTLGATPIYYPPGPSAPPVLSATYSPTTIPTGLANASLIGSAVTPVRGYIDLYQSFTPISAGTITAGPKFTPPTSGYTALAITVSKDTTSVADYQLAKAVILPSDVRIEAVMYAQDNSFFLIPGDWFNNDSADTLLSAASRPRPATGSGSTDPLNPFYGQPIDMKISIDGSVSENLPANISDQQAWMLKWGWIPHYHGSYASSTSTEPSPHPLQGSPPTQPALTNGADICTGLNFTYDQAAGSAYLTATGGGYLRLDQYGRPLPYAPNLPVSPDLLYSGQTTGNSLVQ